MRRHAILPWVSVREIAEHLGVSKETVYRWVESRGMPAHRVGRLMKFQVEEVDRWVRSGGLSVRGSGGGTGGGTVSHADGAVMRERLLDRYSHSIVLLETQRARASEPTARAGIQALLTRLMTARSRLEILPAGRLTSLGTLEHLELLERSATAAASAETPEVRGMCMDAANGALERIMMELR